MIIGFLFSPLGKCASPRNYGREGKERSGCNNIELAMLRPKKHTNPPLNGGFCWNAFVVSHHSTLSSLNGLGDGAAPAPVPVPAADTAVVTPTSQAQQPPAIAAAAVMMPRQDTYTMKSLKGVLMYMRVGFEPAGVTKTPTSRQYYDSRVDDHTQTLKLVHYRPPVGATGIKVTFHTVLGRLPRMKPSQNAQHTDVASFTFPEGSNGRDLTFVFRGFPWNRFLVGLHDAARPINSELALANQHHTSWNDELCCEKPPKARATTVVLDRVAAELEQFMSTPVFLQCEEEEAGEDSGLLVE